MEIFHEPKKTIIPLLIIVEKKTKHSYLYIFTDSSTSTPQIYFKVFKYLYKIIQVFFSWLLHVESTSIQEQLIMHPAKWHGRKKLWWSLVTIQKKSLLDTLKKNCRRNNKKISIPTEFQHDIIFLYLPYIPVLDLSIKLWSCHLHKADYTDYICNS